MVCVTSKTNGQEVQPEKQQYSQNLYSEKCFCVRALFRFTETLSRGLIPDWWLCFFQRSWCSSQFAVWTEGGGGDGLQGSTDTIRRGARTFGKVIWIWGPPWRVALLCAHLCSEAEELNLSSLWLWHPGRSASWCSPWSLPRRRSGECRPSAAGGNMLHRTYRDTQRLMSWPNCSV